MSKHVHLEPWEIERLIDFFRLLDQWDRRQSAGTQEKRPDRDALRDPLQPDQGSRNHLVHRAKFL